MKALFRIVHPYGDELPHMLVVPQPKTEAERELRKKWPDDIRFEMTELNVISLDQDSTDWVATFARMKLKG
jgi:hypothetical protein